jgi:hypothetical protein
MTAIVSNILSEAQRLLEIGDREGATMAVLGGVAVRLRAPEVPSGLDREYKDIDLAVPKGYARDAAKLLDGAGYDPEIAFNAMNGKERLLFHDDEHGRHVDVFIGRFRMCHEISFGNRLTQGQRTLPLAELLLTKLQIIELNEKDVRDALLLFHGHKVADRDGDAINATRIAELCADDWGLWRTITANLVRCGELLQDYTLAQHERERIGQRLGTVLQRIEVAPKSRSWKLRAKIGERKRWYELPEEVER